MATEVIYTRLSPTELRQRLAEIPAIAAGKSVDRGGIARGLALRVAVTFLGLVKLAFIVKARGGTDDAGISWPPLTQKYLAYGRGPFSTRRAGKSAPGIVRGGPRDGQQNDGFLSPAQMKRWRGIYAGSLRWLSAKMPTEEAKGRAAAIAWATLKREGAQTKLEVFGTRVVDILRDRGSLFNSLSPGILSETGADADYSPPYAQVVKVEPGAIAVGTNIEYAAAHQYGKRAKPGDPGRGAVRRQIWPDPGQVPAEWGEQMAAAGARGLAQAVRLIASGQI